MLIKKDKSLIRSEKTSHKKALQLGKAEGLGGEQYADVLFV